MAKFEKGNPGRPKGARNLVNRTVEETVRKLGLDPFEIVCLFAMGDWKTLGFEKEKETKFTPQGLEVEEYTIKPELRAAMAKEACKYIYSQKKALELTTPEGSGFKIIVEDYTSKK